MFSKFVDLRYPCIQFIIFYFFYFRFLDLCYKKLVLKKSNASDKCGFFRINRESVVPYTVKDTIKYVPLFYFEGETDHLKLKSDSVDSWDLAYLKFCCKVQGIRNELFAADTCRVVALEEIKGHFPSGTTFEDYWPAKGSIEPVHHSQRVSAGNWTQKPVSVVPQNHAAHPASAAHQNNSAQQPPAAHSRTNYTSQQATVIIFEFLQFSLQNYLEPQMCKKLKKKIVSQLFVCTACDIKRL